MKNKTLKKVVAILVGISFMTPFLTQTKAAETDAVLENIQKKGKLTIGLSADYPPYEFHATVDGKDKVVGADVSMGEKIAKDLGVELVVEELGFDALLGSMKTGKVDLIISGMSPTPERQKEVNFTDPYIRIQQKVLIRKADSEKFKNVTDFNGKSGRSEANNTRSISSK